MMLELPTLLNIGASFIIAFATIFLAFLTYKYVRLTQNILDNQNQAHVVVSLELDKSQPELFCFFIRNLGRNIAKNIKFEFSEPLPQQAFAETHDSDGNIIPMSKGALACGIPALAPGEERQIVYGVYDNIRDILNNRTILITCIFDNFNGKKIEAVYPINISSFEADSITINYVARIQQDISKIEKNVSKIQEDFRKITNKLTS